MGTRFPCCSGRKGSSGRLWEDGGAREGRGGGGGWSEAAHVYVCSSTDLREDELKAKEKEERAGIVRSEVFAKVADG